MLQRLTQLLSKAKSGRDILTLVIGTTIGQAILIVCTPILTRIYTPAEFGVFALYLAITSITSVIATGRYEFAIMLPKKDIEAANIVVLSMMVAVGVSLLTFVVVLLFNLLIASLIEHPEISYWLYFTPLATLITGFYQSLNYWGNRKKRYKCLATSRVVQSSAMTIAHVGAGFGGMGVAGLIIGRIFGQGMATVVLGKMAWQKGKKVLQTTTKIKRIALAKKYRKFPIFSTWGALFDNASLEMPILILTKFFGTHITGSFSLTRRVLNLPLSLISGSLSQVLFQRVVKIHRTEPHKLHAYIFKIFFLLFFITVPFVLVIMLWGKEIFTLFFGEDWSQSGDFATLLSLAVAIRFAVSPLSPVLTMDHNIKKGVLWQTVYFVTITTTLLMASNLDVYQFTWIYVIHEIVLYSFYFYLILMGARHIQTNGD